MFSTFGPRRWIAAGLLLARRDPADGGRGWVLVAINHGNIKPYL